MNLKKALEIVINLAEGNALDPDDPDVKGDEALAESAVLQAEALKIVNTHANKL